MELWDVGIAPLLQLAQERITRADELHTGRIDVDHAWGIPPSPDPEGLTPGIVGGRAPVVFHTIANAGAIDRDHVALILDRARAGEHIPVRTSSLWPVRYQKCRVHVGRYGAK